MFKVIKDASFTGKRPGMRQFQDRLQTFKEFDGRSIKGSVMFENFLVVGLLN